MIGKKLFRLCGPAPFAVAVFFWGCASLGPSPSSSPTSSQVGQQKADLENLRPTLHTLEDSLVLDLMLGYRQLQIDAGAIPPADRETLRRSRNAYDQLEYLLRHGGVRDHGRDQKVFILPGGEKVTVQEMIEQLSRAMLKAGADGDWQAATDRAHEIERHRLELSSLVEDAGWCLALADALQSPLPDEVKQRLRHLHESYMQGAPHDQIVNQVNALLPVISDDRLRREMKKLANRSWERDKLRGGLPVPSATVPADTTGAALVPAPANSAPASLATPAAPTAPDTSVHTSAAAAPAGASPALPDSVLLDAKNRVDTLASHGSYLEALRVLESVSDQAGADWVKQRRQTLGDRYCEERRAAAASSYAAARKAADDSARVRGLRQSVAALDSCLFNFPDAPVAAKVRRNRDMVEKELHP